MRILITGAAGFIGSHACEYFTDKGNFVTGIDNFDDCYPRNRKEYNLKSLKKSKYFSFYERDIRNRTLIWIRKIGSRYPSGRKSRGEAFN